MKITTPDNNNLYRTFPLTTIQQAYIIGRTTNLDFGGVATYIYVEAEYTNIDINKLEQVLNTLIKRHLGLRTIFTDNTQCYLETVRYYKVKVNEIDSNSELEKIRNSLSHVVLDHTQFPLFHFEVSHLKYNNRYILHIGWDMLIMDGSSIKLLIEEMDLLYQNPALELPNIGITFRDYVVKNEIERKNLKYIEKHTIETDYWMQKLAKVDLSIDLPLNPITSFPHKFKSISKVVNRESWNKFTNLAKQYSISPMRALLHLYGVVLCYYSDQTSICINVTLGKRESIHPDINKVIGDFTKLELLNFKLYGESFLGGCKLSDEILSADLDNLTTLDGIEIQNLIRKEFKLEANNVIAPIVFTGFVKNFAIAPKLGEEKIKLNYIISQTPQIWLDNKIAELNGDCLVWWDYVDGLFDEETITNMHSLYCELIDFFATHEWTEKLPDLIPKHDLEIILHSNQDMQELSEDTLFSYYENFVKKTKLLSNIAVISGATDISYSYAQLLNDSSLFAKYLYQKIGVHQKQQPLLISILSEKGYNQVIATTSIMKAGYAYLPLNILWPAGTMCNVIEEAMVQTILISRQEYKQEKIKAILSAKCQLLVIEEILEEIASNKELNQVLSKIELPIVNADDVAYVIFTSGSTGRPKGVTISHRGALNTILSVNRRFNLNEKDKVLALSGLSFDLSVYDIFGLLSVGGIIVFPDHGLLKEPRHWLNLINKYQISIWNTVPQLASLLVDEIHTNNLRVANLRLFLLSGDWIPIQLPNKIKREFCDARVISLGGATEGSIWSIWYEIDKVNKEWSSIPYGIAMPNQKIYILNQNDQHCPIDVVGEICIGGTGVALNYWNNSDRTRLSYFQHPELGRLYKTGDLGRWHRDGYVEFVGRQDNQVKVNGYRVELGDIESKLTHIPGIRQAIIKMVPHKNQNYIVGYLLPEDLNFRKQDSLDRAKFKLSTLGIENNGIDGIKLDIKIDEEVYRLRKSYRQYNGKNINQEIINNITKLAHAEVDGLLNIDSNLKNMPGLNLTSVAKLLSVLTCCKLDDKVLPKYLYPSAGSSYAIRSYVNILSMANWSGYYYYNPLQTTLNKSEYWENIQASNKVECIDLIVYWPAIFPLYHEKSRQFAYIEAGHMLNLLLHQARELCLNVRVEICEEVIDKDNALLARLIMVPDNQDTFLNGLSNKNPPEQFKQLSSAVVEEASYIKVANHLYKGKTSEIDLNEQSVFIQADSNSGQVLESGEALIALFGEENPHNLIYAGMYFQELATMLYSYDYGSCMFGLKLNENMLYAMVIGGMDERVKLAAETRAKEIVLKTCIERYIAPELPDYMLPYAYQVIKEVPITITGKVALKQLPEINILDVHEEYVAPRNELEHKICQSYADVLGLPIDKVSVTSDFFNLGGNSVLAMKLVSLINSSLNGSLRLTDVYTLSTSSVELLSDFLSKKSLHVEEVEVNL